MHSNLRQGMPAPSGPAASPRPRDWQTRRLVIGQCGLGQGDRFLASRFDGRGYDTPAGLPASVPYQYCSAVSERVLSGGTNSVPPGRTSFHSTGLTCVPGLIFWNPSTTTRSPDLRPSRTIHPSSITGPTSTGWRMTLSPSRTTQTSGLPCWCGAPPAEERRWRPRRCPAEGAPARTCQGTARPGDWGTARAW